MMTQQSKTENTLVRSNLALKKAESQIEKLQEQLRYSLGHHNPPLKTSISEEPGLKKAVSNKLPESSFNREKQQMSQQIATISEQNQRLKSTIIRIINSINSGMTKTLIDPLNNSLPVLVQHIAQTCKFDVESVAKEGHNPIANDPNSTVDTLWFKSTEVIQRMQSIHQNILSVPTILRVIQQLNSTNGLQTRDMVFTVDDLKRKIGFKGTGVSNTASITGQQAKPALVHNQQSVQSARRSRGQRDQPPASSMKSPEPGYA